jgi:hypothetical protein
MRTHVKSHGPKILDGAHAQKTSPLVISRDATRAIKKAASLAQFLAKRDFSGALRREFSKKTLIYFFHVNFTNIYI